MGGKSSSSNQTHNYTSTTNKSNSAAFNGDMSGHVISGIENSNISVTDHGAVSSALKAMSENSIAVIDSNERVSLEALGLSGDIVTLALGQSARGTEMALDVASNISRDNDNATNQDAVKYMALTGVALAVAFAYRGGH